MLCYVGHHDPAHDWASRRKIETNPVTGGAQIVVILETVREIQTPYQFSFCRVKASLGIVLGFRGEVQIKELLGYPQYHYLPQTPRESKSEQRPSDRCRHPRLICESDSRPDAPLQD